jgi:hypothetical protein
MCSADRIQGFSMLKQLVHIKPVVFKGLRCPLVEFVTNSVEISCSISFFVFGQIVSWSVSQSASQSVSRFSLGYFGLI